MVKTREFNIIKDIHDKRSELYVERDFDILIQIRSRLLIYSEPQLGRYKLPIQN